MEIADNTAVLNAIFGSTLNRSGRLANLGLRELDKGLNQFTNKSYELAIESFNKAIRLAPGGDAAINANDYKARAQLTQGDKEGAIASYKAALKIDPKRDDLHARLGNIYTTEKRFDEAAAEYELAVKNNPGAANRYSLGQGYLGAGRLDEAKAQFEMVRQLSPKDPFGNFGLGQTYARQGRYDFAMQAFDAAIATKNDYWEAYAEKGFALTDSGDVKKALDIKESLLGNDDVLAAQLGQYIYEKSQPKMMASYVSPIYSSFPATRGPGTQVSGVNAYLANADAQMTVAMVFQFSKQMDANSVQMLSNWSIERAIGTGRADGYNLNMLLRESEVELPKTPFAVYYDQREMTATVLFKITQNAAGNGTIDPSHINFTFSGTDSLGLKMDKSADMYSGFSSFA